MVIFQLLTTNDKRLLLDRETFSLTDLGGALKFITSAVEVITITVTVIGLQCCAVSNVAGLLPPTTLNWILMPGLMPG